MSNNADRPAHPERAAFQALEAQVGRVLELLQSTRSRAVEAEARRAEVEELLRRFTGDEAEAGRLLTRLKSLEAENADLRGRLGAGREGVERLLARIRFLENQR